MTILFDKAFDQHTYTRVRATYIIIFFRKFMNGFGGHKNELYVTVEFQK